MNESIAQVQSKTFVSQPDAEKRHHLLLLILVILSAVLVTLVLVQGLPYYLLDPAQRPLSPAHLRLKPSGTVGLRLGMFGLLLFALVYLYPLRKHWPWLAKIGKTKHWLDYHVAMGLVAPVLITFHSSLKFQGFAGMAYWTMAALVVSGLIGRYFYAQIPKSLEAAEMSLRELEELRSQLTQQLEAQKALPVSDLNRVFHLPDIEKVQRMSLLRALALMASMDVSRPFKIRKVRCRLIGTRTRILTIGGVLHTHDVELERAIEILWKQAMLSKKILFLSKAQRVFHLWHVVHRPFSYSFAILVAVHVTVVVLLGYF
jgi:hypothetical protein